MITLVQLREYMKKQAEADRLRQSVQVAGSSIEECLEQAAIELGIPVKKIEYELLEKGSKGTLGMGKKNYILVAYPYVEEEDISSFEEDMDFDTGEDAAADIVVDTDSRVLIRLAPDGAYLKITNPIGKGKKAVKKTAIDMLLQRGVERFDELAISNAVKQSDDTWIKVGEFDYNPLNDAIMAVDIVDGEMTAKIHLQPPGPGGADLTFDTMVGFLKNNSVNHGIKEEVLHGLSENPVYNEEIVVAEGTKPENGADAKIIYNFETESHKVHLKEVDGKVDFKELNLIQNVVEGQILAKKVPAAEGQSGRTVTGQLLPAKAGSDVEMGAGNNVKVSADGLTMTAVCNGQVLLITGKVHVEPVYIVDGDVNMKVGNIVHLGTVIVKGNVDDGFKVKASGNIDIKGTVGKCELDAEGDIVVHQGITGKSGGHIKAGKSVWSKFIENAIVEVGDNVVASDGIINSNVNSNHKIVCMGKGKRARIVGGHLRAAEEIIAESFGSTSGAETIMEVGYDPKSREKMASLSERKEALTQELEELELNVSTLVKLKKVKKQLPEDKETYLSEQLEKKGEIETELAEIGEEMETTQEYLASLKFKGKISAAKQVFPGVKVIIKDAVLEIRNEFKAVSFINENNVVQVTKYVQSEEDFSRK